MMTFLSYSTLCDLCIWKCQ